MLICGVTEKYSWEIRAKRNVCVDHWSAGIAISLNISTPVWTVSWLKNVNNATVENSELSEFYCDFADLIRKTEWSNFWFGINVTLSFSHSLITSRSQYKNVL